MKTSELTGAALDWAVAKCEGVSFVWLETDYSTDGRTFQRGTAQAAGPHYSTNWAQGGPIIEREKLDVCIHKPTHQWCSATQSSADRFARGYGPTPLIAAMRCYVASKLGDEVDVPEELK
jgi:hypothetical protein